MASLISTLGMPTYCSQQEWRDALLNYQLCNE